MLFVSVRAVSVSAVFGQAPLPRMETSHVECGSETSPDNRAAAMRKMTGIFNGLFPASAVPPDAVA